MKMPGSPPSRYGRAQRAWRTLILRPRYWPLVVLAWGMVAAVSYGWDHARLERYAYEMAVLRGRLVFSVIQTTRAWATGHGVIYVPVSPGTPPNPYLDEGRRVIAGPDGVALTQMNPAYMTRQIGELLAASGDLRIHLTSLDPLNPDNAPDEWERAALGGFARGEQERIAMVDGGAQPLFRYMAPLRVESDCVACHARQNFRVGSMAGGLSVSQPARYVLDIVGAQRASLLMVHLGGFVLLSLMSVLGLHTTRRMLLRLTDERDQRRRTAETLAAKLGELETAHEELLQSEKMASLGRMVAGFAHEVNTPVGIAVGAASNMQVTVEHLRELLAAEEVQEDQLLAHFDTLDEAARLTVSNLRRAAALIQGFKRTSIDQTSEEVRAYRLDEVIDDVRMSLDNLFRRGAISVSVDCPADLAGVGVAGAIGQILANLLMNSVQHGYGDEQGGGQIRIVASAQPDGWLQIDYADDGAGMDETTLARIFEPFFTTRRAQGGSGLGLYLVYNLATHTLGGSISCASTKGAGTRFCLRFPGRAARRHPSNHEAAPT
ncbi:MAG: DUF3365 domain-containing protein [Rhodocyclales bacterium]|nr:DUF3365 domain-containing protein [Rhodocyclales bacterium]